MRHMLAACGLALASPVTGEGLPDLVRSGEALGPDQWLISDWDAGQSAIVRWHGAQVRRAGGELEFVLGPAPEGAGRPVRGAEIQSGRVARTGTWRFRARAPEMEPGAVFGLFLYQADWRNDPWREYDFEFVGADTTQVQLNIHFETEDGRHVSLDQARGGPVIVDLGFDAAEGFHDYAIIVGEREAVFRVDGEVVGRFAPEDMPGGVWDAGPLRAFVDLWAVAPAQEGWAGTWEMPDAPLVGALREVEVPR